MTIYCCNQHSGMRAGYCFSMSAEEAALRKNIDLIADDVNHACEVLKTMDTSTEYGERCARVLWEFVCFERGVNVVE